MRTPIGFLRQNAENNGLITVYSVIASEALSGYAASKLTNYTLPNIGADSNGWFSNYQNSVKKLAFDFNEAKKLKTLNYHNYHHFGEYTFCGVAQFRLYGSNNASTFNTNVDDVSNLSLLLSSTFLSHPSSNYSEVIRSININSSEFYRYYILFFDTRQIPSKDPPGYGFRRLWFYE